MNPLLLRSSLVRRIGVTTALAGALLAASTGVAAAHVTVSSPDAASGGYAVLTFRVPNESATASTTAVTVSLPTATPLASVSVQPVPGWTIAAPEQPLATPITTDDGPVTSAVTQVTWTATAGGLAPGEFGQFLLSVGPLPKTDQLVFPTVQTYSDGSEVDWVETAAAGSDVEPEHPAPTLALSAAASSDHHGAATTDTDSDVTVAASNDSDSGSGLATTGVVLGGAGLLLGAAALLVALRTRSRRPAGTPTA